ncbi:hypothetical protein B0A52_00565 [Exophiala mesophila]|uniref:N-acetyltransferase domain-containing protein n=1 Tax=Exophiala mesophila TaxID=212818 RepID=A0A438NHK5_EXOME|nr:hypothetical protein B0A52_00565 [Exophiala mesophila]
MPFIRLYQTSDHDAMVHIFNETVAPDLRAGGKNILYLSSHIWCRPYLFLQPQTCFVLDDGDGNPVGYLLGVVDTHEFVRKYKETYIPYLLAKGLNPPAPDEDRDWSTNLANALKYIMHHPEGLLHSEAPDLVLNYPAHLHIDVLTSHQKQGYGRQLIQQFGDAAKKEGARGMHLLMAASNEDANRFYPRVGFVRFPHVLDGGDSGEQGRDKISIWYVKDLELET